MRKVLKVMLFILGLALCFFPLVSEIKEQRYLQHTVATYEKDVATMEVEHKEAELERARLYNQTLFQLQENQLNSKVEEILSQETYDGLFNQGENGVMGSVEIPKIGVNLPIYHGTSDEVLSVGAGHVQESSLPIGGASTRTIITGHRGLPNSKLFTRLDEMEKGDLFYLHTMGEILAYEVREIQVIKPEKVEVLKIKEGEDLATLITCTPYGINSHRLLVTGERVPYVAQEREEIEEEIMSPRELVFLALPFLFLTMGIVTVVKEVRKKGRHEK